MRIDILKNIPIVGVLSFIGYNPVMKTKGGAQWMYLSPFRIEQKPSFSVSINKNLWYDFGTNEGGNIFDLVIRLNRGFTFHNAAMWLSNHYDQFFKSEIPCIPTISQICPRRHNYTTGPLLNKSLISYLESRAIPKEIGTIFCKEVHYSHSGKNYFAIGFENILGGFELRNPYFKGCFGVKAPTIVPIQKTVRTSDCCVFEGFMDFLSYKTLDWLHQDDIVQKNCDCVILNSTSIVHKAIPFINVYNNVYCYLDNDESGLIAYDAISNAITGHSISLSLKYSNQNDLNDFLIVLCRRNMNSDCHLIAERF